jgi:hypothetical protein
LTATQVRALVDQQIRAELAKERDRNTSSVPPFRMVPDASIRPNRNTRPDPCVLSAALQQNKQKLMQPTTVEEHDEAQRAIAVLQALLDGTPLPKHLGVPIVSFDGSVTFSGSSA